ncbi:hypothetical protein Gotur_033817 [Gossypium turneri]
MLMLILMMKIRLCYYCALYPLHTIDTNSTICLIWMQGR